MDEWLASEREKTQAEKESEKLEVKETRGRSEKINKRAGESVG